MPGQKLTFKHDKNTSVYVLKEGKGGVNQYQYQEVILKPLLLPFAKECLKERPSTLIQEDEAPSHSSRYQHKVFSLWEITRLLWSANSLDLNMIKPCWFQIKRYTTKHSLITSRAELKEAQIKCQQDLPQEKIQAQIERIVVHIKEVIRLDGGNEYREGRLKGQPKNRVHQQGNQWSSRRSSGFTGLSGWAYSGLQGTVGQFQGLKPLQSHDF